MADNEFIVPLECDESPWLATSEINENCQEDGIFSEVKYLLLADTTQNPVPAPVDWEAAGAGGWADVIDNTDATGASIKQILGVGNVTYAAGAPRQMAARKQNQTVNTYTLTFKILETPQNMYNFLQKMEDSNALPNFWFVTTGGMMFGSPTGIVAKSKDFPFLLNEGLDSYEEYDIILTWESKTRPLRIVSPI